MAVLEVWPAAAPVAPTLRSGEEKWGCDLKDGAANYRLRRLQTFLFL